MGGGRCKSTRIARLNGSGWCLFYFKTGVVDGTGKKGGQTMLFVTLLTLKPTTKPEEALQRRAEWKQPESIKPIAEYWLLTYTPNVISIDEADDFATLMAATMPWADLFDFAVVPAISVEEGLKLASQMMPKT